eukprot:TRINITY_DN326_c1_g2_i1.p1 TRINITY_DN326_c1_g2~~TRINITY_DN326_c1_g2_i1.p1  ORF type:complete len:278 (+),score=43.63 TRINITY_DN326_c1_g2_i1:117-950(+)
MSSQSSTPMMGVNVLAAGSASQIAEVLLFGHVLDRVKVHQQISMTSTRTAMQQLIARGGVKELYKGIEWNLTQATVKGGLRWGTLTASDKLCSMGLNKKDNPTRYNTAVGVSAGILETTLVTCPMESIKVRQMVHNQSCGKYSIRNDIMKNGVSIIYKGWTPMCIKQALTWCTFLVAYEQVKQTVKRYRGDTPLSTSDKVMIGVGTGSISTLVQAPADAMKTVAQSGGKISDLTKTHGLLRPLFNGMSLKLVRHCTTAVVSLLTLEYFGCMPDSMKL